MQQESTSHSSCLVSKHFVVRWIGFQNAQSPKVRNNISWIFDRELCSKAIKEALFLFFLACNQVKKNSKSNKKCSLQIEETVVSSSWQNPLCFHCLLWSCMAFLWSSMAFLLSFMAKFDWTFIVFSCGLANSFGLICFTLEWSEFIVILLKQQL